MTIRRRLYISNILMIVLPPVICLIVVGIISSLLTGALGGLKRDSYNLETDILPGVRLAAEGWSAETSAATIEQSLSAATEGLPESGIALRVYRDGQAIVSLGRVTDASIPADALVQAGDHTYIVDSVIVMVETIGEYTLVSIQENVMVKHIVDRAHRWRLFLLMLAAMAGMVAVILLVNSLLTRMIFHHIMPPLDTLTDGVHQIAEGNLSYRIHYEGRDEFTPVIDDFNDMARHLQAMVTSRQKDDESRRELIAGISHDLRTPLTSIIGYVEGLEKGVAITPDMQARYLSIIHDQADILSHTINQLFLFTKLDTDSFPMHMERIDIVDELRTYVGLVSDAYAGKMLTISLAVPPGSLYV
ncbi:HAMP domain-containing histidine kinase, partial [Eubacteriales bacterium OttesenSCG-928-A19]|nr:HAMP domain-containing histidine kinase [Eubacteriales bacterium OttesenSCG-928-A19]